MSYPILLSRTSVEVATGSSAADLSTTLDNTQGPGLRIYALWCNQDFWWAQGIADTVFTADHTVAGGTFTVTAGHKLVTGQPVQVSNSGGALPTGLSAATTYWAIVTPGSLTTFQLATSLANALAGTAITVSDNGTGTQTATTVAVAATGNGSTFTPAGSLVFIDGTEGAKLSVIEDSAAGKASITQCMIVR